MKRLVLGALTAAAIVGAAVPAMAQGFYVGPGGFGVGFGGGPYWGGGYPYGYGDYYDYYGGGPEVYVAPRFHRHWHHR